MACINQATRQQNISPKFADACVWKALKLSSTTYEMIKFCASYNTSHVIGDKSYVEAIKTYVLVNNSYIWENSVS